MVTKSGIKRRRRPRGFALFAIIILLALMTSAVAVSLDETVANIQSAGGVRASEMIRAGLDFGMDLAMLEIQRSDVGTLANPPPQWDIFSQAEPSGGAIQFLAPVVYPPAGPYAGQYRVRFGLRPGQRTRAPAGEDVNSSYGQIVELQLGIEAIGAGIPPVEERVTVGVLIPRRDSHAN
jgi:hypothetical protein